MSVCDFSNIRNSRSSWVNDKRSSWTFSRSNQTRLRLPRPVRSNGLHAVINCLLMTCAVIYSFRLEAPGHHLGPKCLWRMEPALLAWLLGNWPARAGFASPRSRG